MKESSPVSKDDLRTGAARPAVSDTFDRPCVFAVEEDSGRRFGMCTGGSGGTSLIGRLEE